MLKFKNIFSRCFLFVAMLALAACGGGSSSSENAMDALECTSVTGATLTNNCEFNVFAEVLSGADEGVESGADFFVPTGSSVVLPVSGVFTFGVCRGPSRPRIQGDGFVCE